MFPDLSTRRVEPERMDDPGIDPAEHDRALAGLRRIHAWTGTTGRVWAVLRRWMLDREQPGAPFKLLDVACGGGTLLAGLLRRSRRAGLLLHADGADLSPHAAAVAAKACRGVGGRAPAFLRLDAAREDPPPGYDAVVSSLFLHHLDDPAAAATLGRLGRAAPRGLIHDLERSRRAYLLAAAGCRLLSRSPVVHADGPQSVAAGFTPEELRALGAEAELPDARVSRRPFGRLHLRWGPP